MTFGRYQECAMRLAVYPDKGNNYTYPVLGLCGEAGEVAEKVKKLIRDGNGEITKEFQESVAKELGDVLWYLAAVAKEFRLKLEDIANKNLEKLADRANRGVLHGSGDNR